MSNYTVSEIGLQAVGSVPDRGTIVNSILDVKYIRI